MFTKTTRESFIMTRTVAGWMPKTRNDQKLAIKHLKGLYDFLGTQSTTRDIMVHVTTTRGLVRTTSAFSCSWLTN